MMRRLRNFAGAVIAVIAAFVASPAGAAVTMFSRAEGTTFDGTHDYSAGDTSWTLVSAAAFSASGVKVGTNGLHITTTDDYAQLDAGSIVTPAAGTFAFWLRVNTWADGTWIMNLQGTSGSDYITIETTGGDELLLRHRVNGGNNVTLATTAASLATGNWYFVQAHWSAAQDDLRLEVYNSSGTLIQAVENLSAGLGGSPADLIYIRVGTQGASAFLSIDNIFFGSAYADDFLASRDITSYTSYGGGGALPTITDAEDEAFYGGELAVTITGSNFGSTQGAGRVVISPTDDIDDVNAVEQTVTSWSASSIDFTVVRSSLSLNTNLYLFVEENGGNSNAAGYVVQITGDKKIKLLLNSASVGATVDGVVFEAPVSGIVGPEVCEFTGQTVVAGSGADAGKGVLKIVTATFGANALAPGDAPLVYVKNATNFTPIWPATVIVE